MISFTRDDNCGIDITKYYALTCKVGMNGGVFCPLSFQWHLAHWALWCGDEVVRDALVAEAVPTHCHSHLFEEIRA